MSAPRNPDQVIPLQREWGPEDYATAAYQQQLDRKVDACQRLLAPWSPPAPDIFKSPEQAYRQRCEFHIHRDGERLDFAMFTPGSKNRYAVSSFPAASPVIQAAMPTLREAFNTSPELGERLFRVDFLSSLAGELLVTLVYHRALDDGWRQAAAELRERLRCQLVGRSRKQKLVLGQDFITEQLAVNGERFRYRQVEGSFTQPNALVNREMLEWAQDAAQGSSGDLLELYCGNGNFSLPLSRRFNKVLATEVSKTAIAALDWNLAANGIDNILCARLSAEEAAQAIRRERPFRRLAHLNLDDFALNTLFVDPPRAGLDPHTLAFAAGFERIIYISCNPESLAQNLALLGNTHCIDLLACFDQFPFTPHLEVGVRLVRR